MAGTRLFGKNHLRGITWEVRKGEQSFLCMTHLPNIFLNGYQAMEDTRKTDRGTYGGQSTMLYYVLSFVLTLHFSYEFALTYPKW